MDHTVVTDVLWYHLKELYHYKNDQLSGAFQVIEALEGPYFQRTFWKVWKYGPSNTFPMTWKAPES